MGECGHDFFAGPQEENRMKPPVTDKEPKKELIAFKISPELHERIKKLADKYKITKSAMIHHILSEGATELEQIKKK